MENKKIKWKTCPRCGDHYTLPSAISRKDNKTKICPVCGNEEALLDFLFQNQNDIPRID